jgi:hypothetical protein
MRDMQRIRIQPCDIYRSLGGVVQLRGMFTAPRPILANGPAPPCYQLVPKSKAADNERLELFCIVSVCEPQALSKYRSPHPYLHLWML